MFVYRALTSLPLTTVLLAASVTSQLISGNTSSTVKGSVVDLGYSVYQGYVDPASELEFFLGVRFAAPPGRWQRPSKPLTDRTSVIQANVYGSQCLQTRPNDPISGPVLDTTGSEDCLYLNVWRPNNASSSGLPVLVWIHGGGYGNGNGTADPTFLTQLTGKDFVFVSIQYRLGAFGFLSSAEVHDHGVVNAGLLDQNRALQWVQQHIGSFGGDADQVTIFGESAGAGSVMQQLLSYGGSLGTSLFNRAILASPYLPKQYKYDDAVPTKAYQMLAEQVGCDYPIHNYVGLFDCLSLVDSHTLAIASDAVSQLAFFGTWAFAPVVDGVFSIESPTKQLLERKVNGLQALVGNNADEGQIFVPTNISMSDDFTSYVQTLLPNFSNASLANLLRYYPEPEFSGGLYASQDDRTSLLYSDLTFVCPGNWVADAFSASYRYLYAVPVALHGLDVPRYLPAPPAQVYPAADNALSEVFDDFLLSFMMTGTPTLANSTNTSVPLWSGAQYGQQVSFNVTDGIPISIALYNNAINTTLDIGGTPDIKISSGLRTTNGLDRCDFWRSQAYVVPS